MRMMQPRNKLFLTFSLSRSLLCVWSLWSVCYAPTTASTTNDDDMEWLDLSPPPDIGAIKEDDLAKLPDRILSNSESGNSRKRTYEEVDPVSESASSQPKSKKQKHQAPSGENLQIQRAPAKDACILPESSKKPELSLMDTAINTCFDIVDDEEHIVKIKRSISCSTEEDERERAKQMVQKAALLSLYGEMLLDIAQKLRAQSQASLHSIFNEPSSSISRSCQV